MLRFALAAVALILSTFVSPAIAGAAMQAATIATAAKRAMDATFLA